MIGTDPFEVERLGWNFQRGEYGRPGEVSQSALSAFDMACWDLMGQALGVPIWHSSAAASATLPAYANGWYQAERDPATIAELAAGVVARGYRALKLDPFGAASDRLPRRSDGVAGDRRGGAGHGGAGHRDHDRDARPVRCGRSHRPRPRPRAVPPGLDRGAGPPENPEPLRRVRDGDHDPGRGRRAGPCAAGHARVHRRRALDIVQCDLSHFGGFLPMKRLAGWAEAHYLELAPHNVCGPVATAANVQFAAATPNVRILEHFNDFADPWVMTLVDEPPTVDRADGCFGVPERPGLGLRLDHDVCAEHPATGGRLQLFVPGWEKRSAGGADPA